MNILHINKYYYKKGGAEIVYFRMEELLKKHGHKVIPFSMKSDKNLKTNYNKYFIDEKDFFSKQNSVWQKLKLIFNLFYSFEARKKIKQILKNEKIDIVHIHNIYHQLSPSFLSLFKKAKIPVLMTVHDYKLICPNYSLLSHGQICERCKKNKFYNIVKYRCHKNSFSSSLVLAIESYFHKIFKFYENNIDLLICPSKFMKNKLDEYSIKINKIVLRNFWDYSKIKNIEIKNNNYILYIGRLSTEKGIEILINAMYLLKNYDIKLKIVGDGPEKQKIINLINEKNLNSKIELISHQENNALWELIAKSSFLVMPSLSYENAPLSVIEAFAFGKAVIASKIGGFIELLNDFPELDRGFLFKRADAKDLALKIKALYFNADLLNKYSKNAFEYFKLRHQEDLFYENLMKIYNNLLVEKKNY